MHDGTTVDGTGETPQEHDNVEVLGITGGYLGIERTLTVEDYDTDSATDSAIKDITPSIKFGDDGPLVTVSEDTSADKTAFGLNLDETAGDPDIYATGESEVATSDNTAPATDDADDDEATLTPYDGNNPIGQKQTSNSGSITTGLAGLFDVMSDPGQDNGGTKSYAFDLVLTDGGSDGVATTLKTSVGGETIYLFVENLDGGPSEIVGREGNDGTGAIAFVISLVNPTSTTDAQLMFRQFLAFENPTGGTDTTFDEIASILTATNGDAVGVKLTVTQTDSEGDSDSASATVTIVDHQNTLFTSDDDGPAIDPVSNAVVEFKATDIDTKSLQADMGRDDDGSVGSPTGTGVTITGYEATLTFSYPTGDLVLTAVPTTVTNIKQVDYVDTNDGNKVYFSLTINDDVADPSGWTYDWESFQNAPSPELTFDFDGFPSGQQIYGVFAPNEGTGDSALLVIPKDIELKANGTRDASMSTSLNSSNAENSGTALGISGQSVDFGEIMYFLSISNPDDDIVVGDPVFDKGNYKDGDTLNFDGFIDRTSVEVEISQTTPNGSLVDIRITAYNIEPDDNSDTTSGEPVPDTDPERRDFLEDPLAGSFDTIVEITSAAIYDGPEETATLIAFATKNGDGSATIVDANGDPITDMVVVFETNAVIFKDVADDWVVEAFTAGPADTFAVENYDFEGDSFDIGGVNFAQAQGTEDQVLDWTVAITDFDGDVTTDTFKTGIDGTDEGTDVDFTT